MRGISANVARDAGVSPFILEQRLGKLEITGFGDSDVFVIPLAQRDAVLEPSDLRGRIAEQNDAFDGDGIAFDHLDLGFSVRDNRALNAWMRAIK